MVTLAPDITAMKQQHHELFAAQHRYLRRLAMLALALVLYYVFFFMVYGIEWGRLLVGCQQMGRYFLRMFVWQDFANWPFGYYFSQVGITLAIVFAGTITATLLALPLSFLAARNVMHDKVARPIAFLMRRLFDMLRGIDMAIWGLIFVRAVGMGPLAGVLAIILQDVGLLGKLYSEGHEAVERSPSRGLGALGRTACRNTVSASSPSRFRSFWRSAFTKSSRILAQQRCSALLAQAVSAWFMLRICVCGTGMW